MTWEQFNLETVLRLNGICDEFEQALLRGERPDPMNYLLGDETERAVLLKQLQDLQREYLGLPVEEFLERLRGEGLLPGDLPIKGFADAKQLAGAMIERGLITAYQAKVLQSDSPQPLRLENYLILDRIASGGMGTVYKAVHTIMNRVVALKTITVGRTVQERLPWFLREVQAAAKLTHPQVVTAYDAGQARGVVFLVSEFVEGQDLHQIVSQHGPLSEAEVISIGKQTAIGLQSIHEAGLIHRDIKPSNLMRTPSGVVRVLDVGLAQDASRGEPPIIAGTPGFMAPEQLANTTSPDVRGDVYSLGVTLHFLLTGQLFNPELTTTPRSKLQKLIAGLTATEPMQRPASMAEVLEDFRKLETPRRVPMWLLIALALILLGLIVFGLLQNRHERPSPNPPRMPLLELPYDGAAYQKKWCEALNKPIEVEPLPGLKARFIPPGSFTSGTPSDEVLLLYADLTEPERQLRVELEKPRRYTLEQPIYMSTTEVTVGLFRQFVQSQQPPYRTIAERPDGTGFRLNQGIWSLSPGATWQSAGEQAITDLHPVFNLGRDDAADFCRWLSVKLEGQFTCRLPTEVEWEYSCRAGSTGSWSTGNLAQELGQVAWFSQTVDDADLQIRPVARKQPNAFGLFDMHGNLEEWCSSVPPERGAMLCGGNIRSGAVGVRSAARIVSPPSAPRGGFRVVLIPKN